MIRSLKVHWLNTSDLVCTADLIEFYNMLTSAILAGSHPRSRRPSTSKSNLRVGLWNAATGLISRGRLSREKEYEDRPEGYGEWYLLGNAPKNCLSHSVCSMAPCCIPLNPPAINPHWKLVFNATFEWSRAVRGEGSVHPRPGQTLLTVTWSELRAIHQHYTHFNV